MTPLQVFANGDTNYVSKHNSNNTNVEAAITALETNMSSLVVSAQGPGSAYIALFGATTSVIGVESYACTGASTDLTVAAGFNWKPSIPTVVRNLAPAVISFSGLAAATYYIYADSTGAPVRSVTAGTEDLYSVVWSGASFGTITRIAPVVWGSVNDAAAQISAALATSYTSLDTRLEAGETKALAGDLARTWQTGRLSKSVAGAVDVTLTAVEANNAILNFTGVLTANINVIVPLGVDPREWIATNNTTGAFTLTVKGSSGTGIAIDQGSFANLYQDNTNVLSVSGSGAGLGTVTSVGITAPAAGITRSGSPVTTSGNITLALADDLAAVEGLASTGIVRRTAANTWSAGTAVGLTSEVTGVLPVANFATGTPDGSKFVRDDGVLAVPPGTGGSGTVTNVAQTVPAEFSIAGSPVTTTGTLAITKATQTANTIWAGPTAGGVAQPAFRALVAADIPTQPYDVGGGYAGLPTASVVLLRYKFPRTVVFASGLSPSQGVSEIAATAQTDFDILKNGASVGTMRFAAAATSATFIMASGTTFNASDILKIVAPATPDVSLADIGFTLSGTR